MVHTPSSPLTPRPPSHLPPDLHNPLHSHSTHDTSAHSHSSATSPSFQANHPHWSHLLFPSHWKHLPHLSKGAGPFTTKLVHQTPSGHRIHWESRKHRKRLKQHIDAPNNNTTHTTTPHQHTQQTSLIHRFFPYKPTQVAWWTAVLFDVGSLCFVFSSICLFIPGIYHSEHLNTGYVGWTAFAGSVCFTVGAFLQLGEVMSAPIVAMYHDMSHQQRAHMLHRAYHYHTLHTQHMEQTQPSNTQQKQQPQQTNGSTAGNNDNNNNNNDNSNSNTSTHQSATRANLSSLLYRLDFYVAWIQLIGALAFNINTFSFSGSFELTTPQLTGLVFFCDIFASCCFTISGYLSIMEITHSYLPIKPLPLTNSLCSIEWHITWYNFLGGVGFLVNGILIVYWPDPGQLQPAYPLLIGSVFFQLGSHLQYLEQADTHKAPSEQPQQSDGQQQREDGKSSGSGQSAELQHVKVDHANGVDGGSAASDGTVVVHRQYTDGVH